MISGKKHEKLKNLFNLIYKNITSFEKHLSIILTLINKVTYKSLIT